MTPAQLATLKADFLADPILAAFPNNADGNFAIAAAYNLLVSPDFIVWRTSVNEEEFTDTTSISFAICFWISSTVQVIV